LFQKKEDERVANKDSEWMYMYVQS
jgi:hypothetical protein